MPRIRCWSRYRLIQPTSRPVCTTTRNGLCAWLSVCCWVTRYLTGRLDPTGVETLAHCHQRRRSCWGRGSRAVRPGEPLCIVPEDFVRGAALPVGRYGCRPHQRPHRRFGGGRIVAETGAH